MLSDSSYFSKMKSSRNRPLDVAQKRWSDRQKIECVTTYLLLGGNVILTSSTMKIPEQTIYYWKKSEWWNKLVNEIKQEERLTLSTKLKKVVDKSWDIVSDRLENGDFIYDQKKGELIRKPVSMRDAVKVANDSVMIREKLEMNDNFTVAADQIEDKLTKLAKAFTDLAKGVKPEEQVEDVDFVEREGEDIALDDREEWEDGKRLPEGKSSLRIETSSEKETQ